MTQICEQCRENILKWMSGQQAELTKQSQNLPAEFAGEESTFREMSCAFAFVGMKMRVEL